MKKTLLFLCATLSAFNFVYAQNVTRLGLKTNFNLKRMSMERLTFLPAKTGNEFISPVTNFVSTRATGLTPGSIVLGTTLYDLQTNAAVARRLLRRSDGTMTAVWTIAQQST